MIYHLNSLYRQNIITIFTLIDHYKGWENDNPQDTHHNHEYHNNKDTHNNFDTYQDKEYKYQDHKDKDKEEVA